MGSGVIHAARWDHNPLAKQTGGINVDVRPAETAKSQLTVPAKVDLVNARKRAARRNKAKMAPTAATRARALSLYRQLIRSAKRMPTPNRQNYVMRKTRKEYRDNMHLTDTEEIDFAIRLADTNLDTVMVQAEHLTRLFNDPKYQNDE